MAFDQPVFVRQAWQDKPAKQFLGLAPVEENGADVRMGGKEASEIIGFDVAYVGIETTRSHALVCNIPQGGAAIRKALQTLGIGEFGSESEQFPEDWPEGVPGVGIVLMCVQRSAAWHGAQNQDARIASGNGRKADLGHLFVAWFRCLHARQV